jgi:hypothetical protein
MSEETAYREGMDRGLNGSNSAAGIFDGWFDDKKDSEARERGYEAGQLARAIRGDDD